MKFVARILALAALLASCAGCRSFPNVEATRWVHDGHYGAFTTHYEASDITKLPSGQLRVGTWHGTVTIMGGYGVEDTITGLIITQKDEPFLVPIK